MSDKKEYNFDSYINTAQKKIKEFVIEKEKLNSKLKNYIISFQNFDSEIYNTLFEAREFYSEKRYYYNLKMTKLRNKKREYERIWNHLRKKIKTLSRPQLNENILVLTDYTKNSLEDIENKIVTINKKLEEQILNIDEENELTEQLRKLEKDKQDKIKTLGDLKQKRLKELHNSEYYRTQVKINDLEKDLTEIYENLRKISNKRFITHKKMLDLCKKGKKFEETKKEIENELIKNKISAEGYHQLFQKLIKVNRKVLLDELPNKIRSTMRPRTIKKSIVEDIIKKKKKYKRFKKKKLEIALEKQKLGKKLDFYEYQLILKYSKN